MGLNTVSGKESQDKKYDDKKKSDSAVDKVKEDTKNKVRDVHDKKWVCLSVVGDATPI